MNTRRHTTSITRLPIRTLRYSGETPLITIFAFRFDYATHAISCLRLWRHAAIVAGKQALRVALRY